MTEVKLQPDPEHEGQVLALSFGGIPEPAVPGVAMRVPVGLGRVAHDLVSALLLPIQQGQHVPGGAIALDPIALDLREGGPDDRVWLQSPDDASLARWAIYDHTEPKSVRSSDTTGLVALADFGLALPDIDDSLRTACAELLRRGGEIERATEALAPIDETSPATPDAMLVRGLIARDKEQRSTARSALLSILASDDTGSRGQAHILAATALVPLARARHLDHVLALAVGHPDELVRDILVDALRQLERDDVVAGLMLALTDANHERRAGATQLLGCFPGDDTRAAALTRLGDEDPVVRYQAGVVLAHGAPGSADDYAALVDAADDQAPDVRNAALQALEAWIEAGQAPPPSVIPALIQRLFVDEDDDNRVWAAQALRALAQNAIPAVAALAARLDDSSDEVRSAVADALAATGDAAALPFLRRRLAAETNEDARIYLEDAIAELEDVMPPDVDLDSVESVDAYDTPDGPASLDESDDDED